MSDFNLGTVTAYGYAKDKGYTGTEDEFAELMASYADVAEQAAESAEQAAASATTATAKASEAAQSATSAASSKTAAETAQGGAETAAQTATTKAGEASTSATTASGKATEAITAAGTATTKASEATTAATTATTKAGEASTSATNAAASATRAQEILDSIPEDYSQLSDDVDTLKDGFDDLKEDFSVISETEIDSIKNTTTYNWAISETNGSVLARSAQRSVIMACKANTTYVIKNTKGNRLVVGASSVTPYNGYTFTHYSDLSSNLSDASFTTGTDEVYLMVNYYYTNTTYTEDEALSALEVYSQSIGAIDNVAREEIASLEGEVATLVNIAQDSSADVTQRAILGTGEISARQKFRMVRVECTPSTSYTIESPKGKYLMVGSSESSSYTQILPKFTDYGRDPGTVTYTTDASHIYLFCVFYYQDYTSETDTDSYNALTIEYVSAIDKVARGTIDEINNNLNNKIDGLNVSWIKGKKVSIIGDSISTYDQVGYKIDGYNMYYPKGDVTSVEDTWWKQIFRYCGGTMEVNASSGESRVTDTNPNVPSLYDRVSLIGNPDTIFIELGTNDSTYAVSLGEYDFESAVADLSESTFRTAYIKGVKALQASYPSAQIILIILSMSDTYAESIIHIAQTMNLPYVICRSYGIYQGVHPNKVGMWNIASAITQRNDVIQNDIDSAVIYANGVFHKLIFNNDGTITWENPLD